MTQLALEPATRALRIALNLHGVTLLVAAFLVGWNAEVCQAVADTLSCQRSWPRVIAWWAAGLVSASVPYFLGRFVGAAAVRLDEL